MTGFTTETVAIGFKRNVSFFEMISRYLREQKCWIVNLAQAGDVWPVSGGPVAANRNNLGVSSQRQASMVQLSSERTHCLTHNSLNVPTSTMLVSLTVGKVDAGVAVLLTEDKRLVCS